MFLPDDMSISVASFMGLVKLYSDKNSMTLKSKALILNPVHAVLLNFPPRWCSWLIKIGHTLIGFLRVGNVESRDPFVGNDITSIHGIQFRFYC